MSLVSSIQAGLCLSAVAAIVGCGTSNTSAADGFKGTGNGTNAYGSDSGFDATSNGGDDGGSYQSSSSGGGSGSGSSSSGGGGTACAPSCAQDSDCQNSCPAVAGGGTNCCDTMSTTCFSTPSSTCPSGQVGAE
jgi:hypothetical protein